MITKRHMPKILAELKDIAARHNMTLAESLAEYLSEIPFMDREICMVCESLGLSVDEYIHLAATPSSIDAFNEQFS